jgi:hypothetical protein
MIEATLDGDELYPDGFVCEILAAQSSGRPGIRGYTGRDFRRGVLTIDIDAALRGWVTGGEFTIFVRRRGVATDLYREARPAARKVECRTAIDIGGRKGLRSSVDIESDSGWSRR